MIHRVLFFDSTPIFRKIKLEWFCFLGLTELVTHKSITRAHCSHVWSFFLLSILATLKPEVTFLLNCHIFFKELQCGWLRVFISTYSYIDSCWMIILVNDSWFQLHLNTLMWNIFCISSISCFISVWRLNCFWNFFISYIWILFLQNFLRTSRTLFWFVSLVFIIWLHKLCRLHI